jgi:hypothetical protein
VNESSATLLEGTLIWKNLQREYYFGRNIPELRIDGCAASSFTPDLVPLRFAHKYADVGKVAASIYPTGRK